MCKKTSFINEQYALDFIEKLKNTSKRRVIPIEAYLCTKCLTWHVSSIRKNELMKLKNEHESTLKKMQGTVATVTGESRNLKKKVEKLTKELEEYKKRDIQNKRIISVLTNEECMIQD